jgi:hypothetical protein
MLLCYVYFLHLCCHAMFMFCIYVVMLCLLFCIYVVMLCLFFCIYVVMLYLFFEFMLLCYVFLLYCSMYSNASLSSELRENRDSNGCCRCCITELLQSNTSPCYSCKFSWRISKYMYLL